jgi:hypothetical protein
MVAIFSALSIYLYKPDEPCSLSYSLLLCLQFSIFNYHLSFYPLSLFQLLLPALPSLALLAGKELGRVGESGKVLERAREAGEL